MYDSTGVLIRIPMAGSSEDFERFTAAGREIADPHVIYESGEPYPLEEVRSLEYRDDTQEGLRIEKMVNPGHRPNLDRTRIIYNAGITLGGIPWKAHEYRLGSRSALDWIVDRYQVRMHKPIGILNDPNNWGDEIGDHRYLLDLVKRVTDVSFWTVDIVASLPELFLSMNTPGSWLPDHVLGTQSHPSSPNSVRS